MDENLARDAAKAIETAASDATQKYSNFCDQLNRAVQIAKKTVGSFGKGKAACTCAMSCYELRVRKAAWLAEAVARAKRDTLCWGGGDVGHQWAQANAWTHVGSCTVWMKLKSCP